MSELNLGRISAKVADIRENLGVLRRYAELPDDEFLRNAEALGAAKYAFVVKVKWTTGSCWPS